MGKKKSRYNCVTEKEATRGALNVEAAHGLNALPQVQKHAGSTKKHRNPKNIQPNRSSGDECETIKFPSP